MANHSLLAARSTSVPTPARTAPTLIAVLLAYLALPMLMSGTSVAVPRIGADLNASGAALQWVLPGYFLTASSLMLVAGSMGDLFGRRRIFRCGAAVFTAGALLSTFAGDIMLLNAARMLTGVGAAGMMASGGAILATSFDGPARTRAFAAMGTTAGVGVAIGPTLSGWMVTTLGWRANFAAFALAGLLVLAGTVLMAESRAAVRPRVDWAGALTLVGGLALVMFGVTRSSAEGWGSALVLGPLLGGVALLLAFLVVERRSAHPVLSLDLLRDRRFVGWSLVGVVMAVGTIGVMAFLPTYLQAVNHASAQSSGTIMLMMTAPVLFTPPIAARLVNRGVPARALATVSLLLIAAGNAWLTRLHPGIGAWELLGPLLTIGVGMGLAVGIVDAQALGLVGPERAGMASGFLNTVRGSTNTLTIAVFGSVLTVLLRASTGSGELADRVTAGDLGGADEAFLADRFTDVWQLVLWVLAGLGVLAAVLVHRLLAPARRIK